MPLAILDIVFAVAGAMINKFAQRPNSTWLFHWAFSSSSFVNEEKTSFFESVESVKGVTNSFADGVITTFTLAPLFTSNRTKNADL